MVKENFIKAYLNKSWASGGVLSGSGSRVDNCKHLITFVEALIESKQISSILDMGCGDLNWIAEVEGIQNVKYYGVDAVPTLIEHHKRVFPWFDGESNDAENIFRISFDLVICKDIFIHLCNGKNEQILQNVKMGEWKYFLCTNHNTTDNSNRRGLNSSKFAEYNVLPMMEKEEVFLKMEKPCGGEYLVFAR